MYYEHKGVLTDSDWNNCMILKFQTVYQNINNSYKASNYITRDYLYNYKTITVRSLYTYIVRLHLLLILDTFNCNKLKNIELFYFKPAASYPLSNIT